MEALANVNQFGVCELREDELMEIDGGGWVTKLVKYLFTVMRDGVVYECVKYVAIKVWKEAKENPVNGGGIVGPLPEI